MTLNLKSYDSYRDQWKARGELYNCPNKSHNFRIGKLIGQWAWAKDLWSLVTVDGSLQNYFFSINSIEWLTGERAFNIILWRFKLIIGFVK